MLLDMLKVEQGWHKAFNFADVTAQTEVAQVILILQQKGKHGFGLTMIDKPFMGEPVETLCVDDILERVIKVSMPGLYKKLDKVGKAVCIEIDVDAFVEIAGANIDFCEPSAQQSTYYDLSLIMKEGVTFADLQNCWNALNLEELNSVKVIDTYENDEMKSVTVRLIFSAKDRTLEMDEVQGWIDTILANLKNIGIELRA